MKKLFIVLALVFIYACELEEIKPVESTRIEVEYSDLAYLTVYNTDADGNEKFFTYEDVTAPYFVNESYLIDKLGTLNKLNIYVAKNTNFDYWDKGSLIVKLYVDDIVVASDTAVYNDTWIEIEYNF